MGNSDSLCLCKQEFWGTCIESRKGYFVLKFSLELLSPPARFLARNYFNRQWIFSWLDAYKFLTPQTLRSLLNPSMTSPQKLAWTQSFVFSLSYFCRNFPTSCIDNLLLFLFLLNLNLLERGLVYLLLIELLKCKGIKVPVYLQYLLLNQGVVLRLFFSRRQSYLVFKQMVECTQSVKTGLKMLPLLVKVSAASWAVKFQIENFLMLEILRVIAIFFNPMNLFCRSCSACVIVALPGSAKLINVDCVNYIFRLEW